MPTAHIDPVCGMTVTPEKAAGSSTYAGTTYYFCGKGCLTRFEAAPRLLSGARRGPAAARVMPPRREPRRRSPAGRR